MSPIAGTPAVPTSDLDPFSDEFLADPHPRHAALRDAGPVVWLERYGVWAMARHEEVAAALRDAATFISSAGVGLDDLRDASEQWRPPSVLLEADPPEHGAARRLVTQVLTPAAVRGLADRFHATAQTLVAELVARGRFDAVPDLAVAYPMAVFPDALGLRIEGRENLLRYASMIFNAFGPRNERYEASCAAGGDSQRWVRAQCPPGATDPDGIAGRIHAFAREEGAPPEIAGGVIAALLAAGLDTTIHALSGALRLLAEHPEQFAALRAEPSRARAAFEESIRLESPVQTFFRTTSSEVQIGGATIPAGAKVLLFLAAANRDPRRWADADRFDIGRRTAGHVGFGHGIHVCVGAMLSRLEGEAVIRALAEQVETIELAGPARYELNNTLRGLGSLPLTVTAA